MDKFIKRSLNERLEIINQTAAKLDMAPAAIEKDFRLMLPHLLSLWQNWRCSSRKLTNSHLCP